MARTRRRDRRIWFLVLGVFSAVFLFSFLVAKFKKLEGSVDAASLANFDPGYIISDYQMGNYNSMSEAEIQVFLTAKGNCRDTRTYLAANYPHLSYHIRDGHFVCLAEERFGEGVLYGEGVSGGETAAHIIWQAAQDYRINPQVLIVLLQKEQGLITDSWPNDRQYRAATGYGCPDTAPCNSEYYGFKNQVRKAASLFRTVLDGGWTNYPLGNNYVQYNPNPGCGGTVVNIRSLATSALYRYTPYQPNASALAAGYGTGDGCGAYGNRNFYLYFEDWFGGVVSEIKQRRKVDPATPGTKQESIIDDKEYIIVSAMNNDFAIDVYGGSINNGANIQLYSKHGSGNQRFKFIYNENGFYEIINSVSGRALNVYGGWMDEETNVQLWDRDGSCASYWRIDKNSDNTYTIQSACSDLVLDIHGGKVDDSKNIQVYFSHQRKNQHWMLEEIDEQNMSNGSILDDALYTIVSADDKFFAIDIYGGIGNAFDGANIQLYNKHEGDNQKFKLVYDSEKKLYEIVNVNVNKSLNVYGAGKNLETNVQLWDRDGSCASYWRIDKNSDNTYTIQSACSDLVLDIHGGKALSEKNLQVYFRHNENNQKWYLEKQ